MILKFCVLIVIVQNDISNCSIIRSRMINYFLKIRKQEDYIQQNKTMSG